MDSRLIVLKLLLDELDIDGGISTIDDRKRIQKAVYLGQRAGVDLGYRFSWYLKGPYSSRLANDYYSLADSLTSGDAEYEGKTLLNPLKDRLQKVRPALQPPANMQLAQEDWLELLASYDYLRRVLRCDDAQARQVMSTRKPDLAPHCNSAEAKLREVGLLS